MMGMWRNSPYLFLSLCNIVKIAASSVFLLNKRMIMDQKRVTALLLVAGDSQKCKRENKERRQFYTNPNPQEQTSGLKKRWDKKRT